MTEFILRKNQRLPKLVPVRYLRRGMAGEGIVKDLSLNGSYMTGNVPVSIGMALAFRLSARLGLAPSSDADRLQTHLRSVSLPVRISDIPGERPDADVLLAHMMHDKKAKAGKLTFVLVNGIGRAYTVNDVPIETVHTMLTGSD